MLTFRRKPKRDFVQPILATSVLIAAIALAGVNEASKPNPNPPPLPTQSPPVRVELVSRGADREQLQKEKIIDAINSNLSGNLGEIFYLAGKRYNVNPMMMAAIFKHETADGTSALFRNNNNPGGIMAGKGWAKYKTVRDGIFAMAELLRERYIDRGLNTIDLIGNVYCPLNDPKDKLGVNKHWIPAVTRIYLEILEEARNG